MFDDAVDGNLPLSAVPENSICDFIFETFQDDVAAAEGRLRIRHRLLVLDASTVEGSINNM